MNTQNQNGKNKAARHYFLMMSIGLCLAALTAFVAFAITDGPDSMAAKCSCIIFTLAMLYLGTCILRR